MDDIFEIQVEFNILKAFFVQLQTTVGDCRYLDALINNHETGVERFQEQERTPGGRDGLEQARKVLFFLCLDLKIVLQFSLDKLFCTKSFHSGLNLIFCQAAAAILGHHEGPMGPVGKYKYKPH